MSPAGWLCFRDAVRMRLMLVNQGFDACRRQVCTEETYDGSHLSSSHCIFKMSMAHHQNIQPGHENTLCMHAGVLLSHSNYNHYNARIRTTKSADLWSNTTDLLAVVRQRAGPHGGVKGPRAGTPARKVKVLTHALVHQQTVNVNESWKAQVARRPDIVPIQAV